MISASSEYAPDRVSSRWLQTSREMQREFIESLTMSDEKADQLREEQPPPERFCEHASLLDLCFPSQAMKRIDDWCLNLTIIPTKTSAQLDQFGPQ